MRSVSRLALTLIAAIGAFVAPVAQAQGPSVPAPAIPAIPPPGTLPPNQPVTFRYTDNDGTGSITLLDIGPDSATGGRQIKVTIQQNGFRFDGSGFFLQLETLRPFTSVLSFTVVSPNGLSYFFEGKTMLGVELTGQGSYHQVGVPERSAPWGLLALPVGTGGGGPGLTSGIRGVAMAGPIFPVERPGQVNERPLPFAIITVQPAGGGPEIARQQADASGQFQIALGPGSYLIVPLPPQPGSFLPRGIPQSVVVNPGQYTQVTVHYDTGIR